METWMKVVSALALGAMLVALIPRARQMLKESPAAQPGDWHGVLLPIGLVVVFVLLLMQFV
ncbi:MAG: hypothetical protein RL434_1792 [Pseudomonadota bacterium]|jgi:hypothetical protein